MSSKYKIATEDKIKESLSAMISDYKATSDKIKFAYDNLDRIYQIVQFEQVNKPDTTQEIENLTGKLEKMGYARKIVNEFLIDFYKFLEYPTGSFININLNKIKSWCWSASIRIDNNILEIGKGELTSEQPSDLASALDLMLNDIDVKMYKLSAENEFDAAPDAEFIKRYIDINSESYVDVKSGEIRIRKNGKEVLLTKNADSKWSMGAITDIPFLVDILLLARRYFTIIDTPYIASVEELNKYDISTDFHVQLIENAILEYKYIPFNVFKGHPELLLKYEETLYKNREFKGIKIGEEVEINNGVVRTIEEVKIVDINMRSNFVIYENKKGDWFKKTRAQFGQYLSNAAEIKSQKEEKILPTIHADDNIKWKNEKWRVVEVEGKKPDSLVSLITSAGKTKVATLEELSSSIVLISDIIENKYESENMLEKEDEEDDNIVITETETESADVEEILKISIVEEVVVNTEITHDKEIAIQEKKPINIITVLDTLMVKSHNDNKKKSKDKQEKGQMSMFGMI